MGVITANVVLAHGLGGRSDLPVDPVAAAWVTALVVAVSFAVTTFARSATPVERERMTARLPRPLSRAVDSRFLTAVLRTLVLVLVGFVVAVAVAGPPVTRFNLAPYAVYVVFWVGLVPLSLLFGPFWRRVNPLRTLHGLVCLLLRRDPLRGAARLPARTGIWPAALSLLIFVWLELVYPDRARPHVVLAFLLSYAAVHLAGAFVFGSRWFGAADGFEVYSRLVGALSPWGRTEDGRLELRAPLAGVAELRPLPGLTAVTSVLLGSTAFDGVTRTRWWQANVPAESVVLPTLAMLGLVALVAAAFGLAVRAGGRPANEDVRSATEALAPSLVPIVVGYTVAHYFSFLLFEGQTAVQLASDPFRRGWDLFGTADNTVRSLLVGGSTTAAVQLYAIVAGHILGVLVAHDRATAVWQSHQLRRRQIPLAVVMVLMTLAGVVLLLST